MDTITLSREALVDLLTTAASLGRDLQHTQTRGDITHGLASYGLRANSSRLDEAVYQAEASVKTEAVDKAGA